MNGELFVKVTIPTGLLFIALVIASARPAASGTFEIEMPPEPQPECVLALPRPRVLVAQTQGREQHSGRPEASLPCAEAVTLYRQAAALGDRVAQNNLGVIYEEGHGTAQDYKEASN